MKVAFIVNNYPPRTGGVELHVQALAGEIVHRGHEAVVVTLGSEPGWRQDRGVAVLTLPERMRIADILGFPKLGTRARLTRLLREQKIDIVSTHTRFFPMSYVGWRAAKAAGSIHVHTEHGSDHVASDSFIIRFASRMVDWSLGRAVLRGASRVLGVSEDVVDFVQRLAGVHAEVFYNAIEPVSLSDDSASVVVDRPAHLVFVGRLVAGKGWADYLETISILRGQGIGVTGEILGDGADLARVHDRVEMLGLGDTVAVRGRVDPAEVRGSLRGATLVNPTRLSEGFQTTLLEAIAEQGRVVTYPVPGALTLQSQGAPVRISAATNPSALAAEISGVLADPPPPAAPATLDQWTWPTRADQYLAMCAAELERSTAS